MISEKRDTERETDIDRGIEIEKERKKHPTNLPTIKYIIQRHSLYYHSESRDTQLTNTG